MPVSEEIGKQREYNVENDEKWKEKKVSKDIYPRGKSKDILND